MQGPQAAITGAGLGPRLKKEGRDAITDTQIQQNPRT